MTHLLQFDGGANPNPGPCAGAFVILEKSNHHVISEGGIYWPNGTNNIGEYWGLIGGLTRCVELGIKNLEVEGDSMLVIQQVSRKWKVKQPHLQPLVEQIWKLIPQFENITFKHIRREFNSYADRLSDQTLDRKTSW